MDANGLRFWLVADRVPPRESEPPSRERAKTLQWRIEPGSGVRYDTNHRTLRLASIRPLIDPAPRDMPASEAVARERLGRVPQTRDHYGTRAWWDAVTRQVRAAGAIGEADEDGVSLFAIDAPDAPTDLAVGYDGVLYAAIDGRVVLYDLRGRWTPKVLRHDGLIAWRLAANPAGGVWVLDHDDRAIWRVAGMPLPTRPFAPYEPTTVRPCSDNPDPPAVALQPSLTVSAGEEPVAIAANPDGRIALLTWATDGLGRLHVSSDGHAFDRSVTLRGARYPYDVTWTASDLVAVLLAQLPNEAPVYALDDGGATIDPLGEFHPLVGHDGGPFVNGLAFPAHFPKGADSAPLYALSAPTLAPRGFATASTAIDSASTQTVWHRLYLEASIPPGCGVSVFLAATDALETEPTPDDWHEHRFGDLPDAQSGPAVPHGAWMRLASELPFHRGLLQCPREPGRAGLFTALIQRSNRVVRALRGRYLRIKVELTGNGRATPDIAALRAYASRFSYRDRYLPELYRETEFGAKAEQVIPRQLPSVKDERTPANFTTPADFLERFLDNFEGILTPLEDRIASAYLLTDPRTAPEDSLEWLASWIGLTFDRAYPSDRRSALLRAAPELYRRHGTLLGLRLALDVATGGGCSGGEIVVVEDFRLRRTFATLLGVDLAREEDPLLGGIVESGNSYVGDTLFLGDEQRKEFLALFGDDMPTTVDEDAAIQALFDRVAHRATVLVHQRVSPQDLGLIRRVVELEAPAHVITRVVEARQQFLVGVASLIGVDSYLEAPVERGPVLVGRSAIGQRDFLQRPASLDYRLGGGASMTNGNGKPPVLKP